MEIPILNVYYLLSYAWNKLDEAEPRSVGQIDNKNIINLFSKILANRTSYLLSRGLDRGYIEFNDIGSVVRGKINISDTYLNNLLSVGKVDCTYDELSHNVVHNQILKSTLRTLLNSDELDKDIREQLRLSFLKLPAEIDNIDVRKDHFRSLKFHRNNYFYDFLMRICELLTENLLVDETNGNKVFQDFTRDEIKMRYLFESFVENFYKKNKSDHGYNVRGQSQSAWVAEPLNENSMKYLPIMKPDIVMINKSTNKKIILDTKYYKKAFKSNQYGQEKVSRNDIFQMFSYMKNLELRDDLESKNIGYEKYEGILLYPTVFPNPDKPAWDLHGHKLSIKFINMNREWDLIHEDLINIIVNNKI